MRRKLDAGDRQLLADVEEYGWHCVHVAAGEEPHWSFYVGLYATRAHPEVVVFGLPQGTSHDLLWQLVRRIEAGERLPVGRDDHEVLEGYACRFVPVARELHAEYLGYAEWFYRRLGRPDFPVLQLVWPDRDGRFPWDEAYGLDERAQPVLAAPADAAGSAAR